MRMSSGVVAFGEFGDGSGGSGDGVGDFHDGDAAFGAGFGHAAGLVGGIGADDHDEARFHDSVQILQLLH